MCIGSLCWRCGNKAQRCSGVVVRHVIDTKRVDILKGGQEWRTVIMVKQQIVGNSDDNSSDSKC